MRTSTSTDLIMAALIKAQAEFPPIPKNKEGYGYKYADLADTMTLIKPILQKYGLMLIQPLDMLDSGCFVVITRLVHKDQWIEGYAPIPAGIKAQEVGAWVTYLRRYSLSILNIITEDDTDGVVKKPDRPPSKPTTNIDSHTERSPVNLNHSKPKLRVESVKTTIKPAQTNPDSEWPSDLDIPF